MRIFLLTILILAALTSRVCAQINIKAEYIGWSDYRDRVNDRIEGKGDAKIVSGNVQIPFSRKLNENKRLTMWGMAISGMYTSFGDKKLPRNVSPEEILNGQISLTHIRPISRNWSMLASLGAGVYMAHTDISKIRMKDVLGSGALVFIWHLKDNLSVGGGLAVNTSFGYPMAFPAFYVNWELAGQYHVRVSMMNAFEISGGMQLNKNFNLDLVAEMSGALALEKIDGKEMMFSHQYIIAGLRPEFVFGRLSIPITAGISATRSGIYRERSLKAFFKEMGGDDEPYFKVAPYFSAALRYNF